MESDSVVSQNVLRCAFEKYFGRKVRILDFDSSTSDFTVIGEHFCSTLKRIAVSYSFEDEEKTNTLSIIAKYLPQDKCIGDFINEMNVFETEIDMYERILSRFLRFDYKEKIAPQLYFTNNESSLLLIEDLSKLNYKTLSKEKGLDMKHCLLVVKKLSYLHAASYALHKMDSSILSRYNGPMFPKTKFTMKCVDMCYQDIIEICENSSVLRQYADKLKRFQDNIWTTIDSVKNREFKFKVLNHGDCWTNNIMFQYNSEKKLTDAAFIDFQIPCYTEPCGDLHYFLATSAQLDVKDNYKIVVDYYFECFTKYLNHFNMEEKPTREDLHTNFYALSFYGLLSATVVLPIIQSATPGLSIESFIKSTGKDGFRYRSFNNPDYLKEMRHFLPFYEKLGAFNDACRDENKINRTTLNANI